MWWCLRKREEIKTVSIVTVVVFVRAEALRYVRHATFTGWELPELPEYYLRVIELIEGLSLVAATVGGTVLVWIASTRPRQGYVGLAHLMSVPERPSKYAYHVSMPDGPPGLAPFVEISDAEIAIALRHVELHGGARNRLYERWWRWRPDIFLALFKTDGRLGAWRPIAVSIVLPLTADGAEFSHAGTGGAVDLDFSHITPPGFAPAALVVDTWIVEAKGSKLDARGRKRRVPTNRFANALVLLHIGVLLPVGALAEIIVEADNKQLKMLLQLIGFKARGGGDKNDHRSVRPEDVEGNANLQRILANVDLLRGWPIGNLRSSVNGERRVSVSVVAR
ncbi:hypothetical protein [uncultured Sphingomonas sp.]